MNGIEKIAGKIAADAKAETDAILAAAGAEAGTIKEKYAAQAKVESERILAAGEEQAREIKRRAASAADQEAKQKLLATKQNMITKAFDTARQKLLALPAAEYTALLAKLAAEAASGGGETVVLSARDKAACGRAVLDAANQQLVKAGKKGGLTLSDAAGAFDGGLLLLAGDVEINCTLDSILRLSKEELTLDVAAALFA